MLQVRFRLSFTVLLVFLTLMHPCGGQPHVMGPSEPIVATLGDDVILPCHLDPVMDVSLMTVEWARPDLDPRFVFVWRGSVELENKKHPSYRGRTSLFTDELKHGNISLKLSRVKTSDEGRYKCFALKLSRQWFVQLVVGAASSPVVQMTRNSSSVVLQCESAGWYPQPEVSWLDGEGNLLSAGPTETSRGPDDLYTVISRLTVEKRHSNNFTCRIQQKNINQIRDRNIQIPDEFFADQSGSGSSAPAIIAVVAVLILVVVAVLGVWKWRQNRNKNKEQPEDEETRNTPEHESLLGQDNGEQQAAEAKTDSLDMTRGETGPQTDQEQDNNVQHPANEGAGTQLSVEQEGRESETLVREKEDMKTIKDTDDQRDNLTAKDICDDKEDSLDESNKETGLQHQTDEETHQTQDNNVQHPASEGSGTQLSVEQEGRESETLVREKEDVKTKKDTDDQRGNLTAKEKCSDTTAYRNPAGSDVISSEDETQTSSDKEWREKDRQTEEKAKDKQTERDTCSLVKFGVKTDDQSQSDKTHQRQDSNDQRVTNDGAVAQCSEEEEHDEQQGKLNDKQQQLIKKLKTKEREEKTHEDKIIKLESQMKDKEEQIKHLKQRLEEVERQRQSSEDENRDRTDLEGQKYKLQEDLEKKQSQLQQMEKDKSLFTQRKLKATSEKEEIMKNLKEEEIRQQSSTQSREKKDDVNDPMEDLTGGMMTMDIKDDDEVK